MKKTTEQFQSSLYLVRRAEALLGALRFFSAPAANALERRFQFLAQNDFWEWEVENLIYSFTSFAERSKTWQTSQHAIEKVGQLGIAIDAKLAERIRWHGGWQIREKTHRVAPMDLLAEVITEWNHLIDLAEAAFIEPMRKNAEKFNIQTRKDLMELRKSLP